jgi:adhesin/invasin
MNTLYQNTHRINALLFLLGLLLLGMVGPQRLAPLTAALQRPAEVRTAAPAVGLQAGPPALLLLQADALVLSMTNGTAQLTARVRDAQGQPVTGAVVQFQSILGTVTPAGTTTDANGIASATFQATGAAGRAQITATVNDLTREAAIQLVNPATSVTANPMTLDFGASQLDPGQTASLSVVLRDEAGQPITGQLITLFGSFGEVTPASALTDATGRITATYRAGQNAGTAMITALAGVAAKSVTFQVGTPATPEQPTHKAFLPLVNR